VDSSSSVLGIRVAASTADVALLVGGDSRRPGLPNHRSPSSVVQAQARQHSASAIHSAAFKCSCAERGATAHRALRNPAVQVTSALITRVSIAAAPRDSDVEKRLVAYVGVMQVEHQIRHAIQQCWAALPPDLREVGEVENVIHGILERAFRELRLEEPDFSDPETMNRLRAFVTRRRFDRPLREAILTYCMVHAREPHRVEEAERQIRRIVDQALRDLREDREQFGFGSG
jgi:hypothetical protein